MADQPPITVEELAVEAGLPLQYLDKVFSDGYAHTFAEFCDPWENIAYHLKLTKVDVNTIKNDNGTAELKRISTLETWSEKFAHRATYRVLIEALIQSKHAKQALKLCRKLKEEMAKFSGCSEGQEKSIAIEQKVTICHTDLPSEEFPSIEVTQSIHQLQMRFICIQNRFLQSGTKTGVTLQQLQTCVSSLPSFTTDKPQALLEASSIKHFIYNLKDYCCALNPDILEGLIEVLGDVESRTMMKEYNRDLDDFRCQTKLKDFIGNYDGPTPPKYKEVQLKLGDNWREKTLADLKLINSQISRQSWLVKMASTRSIYVTFMVPKEDDLEIGVHLRDYLQSQCVLQISVGGVCVFNCEDLIMSEDSHTQDLWYETRSLDKEYREILLAIDNTIFGEDDWNIVIHECKSLSSKWEEIAAYLGLSYSEIAKIRMINMNYSGCLNDALWRWIEQSYNVEKFGMPSWRTLLAVIVEVDNQLFMRLAKEHRTVSSHKTKDTSLTVSATADITKSTDDYPLMSKDADQHLKIPRSTTFSAPSLMNLTMIIWRNKEGEKKRFRLKRIICRQWKELGYLLGIPLTLLQSWEVNHNGDPLECINEVLSHWLENPTDYYPASWEGLYDLLEDVELNEVAEELKQVLDNLYAP